MSEKQHEKPVHDEKTSKEIFEKEHIASDTKPSELENADFTGAVAKTDPVEIALVRKIDWRLMVSITFQPCHIHIVFSSNQKLT